VAPGSPEDSRPPQQIRRPYGLASYPGIIPLRIRTTTGRVCAFGFVTLRRRLHGRPPVGYLLDILYLAGFRYCGGRLGNENLWGNGDFVSSEEGYWVCVGGVVVYDKFTVDIGVVD